MTFVPNEPLRVDDDCSDAIAISIRSDGIGEEDTST